MHDVLAKTITYFDALLSAGDDKPERLAAVAADSIWYSLGRIKGIKVLQLLCKISMEPDSCVRRTEGVFSRQGARSLLVAKFLPGLSTVAPPLAGIFHMRTRRFLLFDGFGSLLWAGTFLGIGFAFQVSAALFLGLLAGLAEVIAGAAAVVVVGCDAIPSEYPRLKKRLLFDAKR